MKLILFVALLIIGSFGYDRDLDRLAKLERSGKASIIIHPEEDEAHPKKAILETVTTDAPIKVEPVIKKHKKYVKPPGWLKTMKNKLRSFWNNFSIRVKRIAVTGKVPLNSLEKKIEKDMKKLSKQIRKKLATHKKAKYWRTSLKRFWKNLLKPKPIPRNHKGKVEDKSLWDNDAADMMGLDDAPPSKAQKALKWFGNLKTHVRREMMHAFDPALEKKHKHEKKIKKEDKHLNSVLDSAMSWFKKIARKFGASKNHHKSLVCKSSQRLRFGQTICLRRGTNYISRTSKYHWSGTSKNRKNCVSMMIMPISSHYQKKTLRYGMPFLLRAADDRYFERRGRNLHLKKKHESYLFRPGFRKHFLRQHISQYWVVLPARRIGRAVCINDDFVLSVGGLGGSGKLSWSINNDDRRLLSLHSGKKPNVLSHKIGPATWFNFVRRPSIRDPCKTIALGDECYEKRCPGAKAKIFCSGMKTAGQEAAKVKKANKMQDIKEKLNKKAKKANSGNNYQEDHLEALENNESM